MKGGALLDRLLASDKKMNSDVKAGDSLCSSDHEMILFRVLREGNKAKCSITTLDLRRADRSPPGGGSVWKKPTQ